MRGSVDTLKALLIAFLLGGSFALAACDGPLEEGAEEIEDAADEVEDEL